MAREGRTPTADVVHETTTIATSSLDVIARRIVTLRGVKVLLDSDLAALYGVQTKRFNEAVKRNQRRFPQDFMFRLTAAEFADLRSQDATSSGTSSGHGGRRHTPRAFSEHGALMAAMILNSPRAIGTSVLVIRAFVKLRDLAASDEALAVRLAELEAKVGALTSRHERSSQLMRNQFREVFAVLRGLLTAPEPPRRPIGFVHPEDRPKRTGRIR